METTKMNIIEKRNEKPNYKIINLIGRGTFGKVYLAVDLSTQEAVAIKRSPKWTNKVSREVDVLKKMKHSNNVVKLKSIFYTTTNKGYRIQNCVFKYMDQSLGKYIRYKKHERKENKCVRIAPHILKKIIFQICTGLKNFHAQNFAHRDLKPDNILIDMKSEVKVEICDLGSAKRVDRKTTSIPYICSRWYRAPELLCGSMHYTTDVDLWSLGCIIFELVCFCPLFPGKAKKDQFEVSSEECSQMINIMEVIGSPNRKFYENLKNCTDKKNNELIEELCNLEIPPVPWHSILSDKLEQEEHELINVIDGLLKWAPSERLKINDVLNNSYFSSICATS